VTILALPDTGRYIVDTSEAVLDLDLDAHIGTVWHSALDAAGQHVDPVAFMFDSVECEVGLPFVIDRWLIDENEPNPLRAGETWGITPAAVEAVR
jgi:hypothetical protein